MANVFFLFIIFHTNIYYTFRSSEYVNSCREICASPASFRRPQLERSVVRTSHDELVIGRHVGAHDFPIVTRQHLERLPSFVGPDLGGIVIRRGDQILPLRSLILDVGQQVRVRRNRVYAGALSQVPYLAGVVLARGGDVKAIRREVDAENGLQMTLHEHDAPTGTQVPNATERIVTACSANTAVALKARRMNKQVAENNPSSDRKVA